MIQSKTRIRITWYILILSGVTILGGFYKGMEGVVISALGTASVVSMAYIGGKTWDNQAKIKTWDNQANMKNNVTIE